MTNSLLNIGSTEKYDFPILPSSYSSDVSVITAQSTSHENITSNNIHIPSTSNNVQYTELSAVHHSLIENKVNLSGPTPIQSSLSTIDNINV